MSDLHRKPSIYTLHSLPPLKSISYNLSVTYVSHLLQSTILLDRIGCNEGGEFVLLGFDQAVVLKKAIEFTG